MTTEIPFFDLEAVARNDLPKEALPQFKPPSNIKDKKKIEEREAKFYEDLPKKMATDPFYARIVCGCFYVGDTYYASINDERQFLNDFWEEIIKSSGLVGGFNIVGYDLPLILVRSVQLGINSTLSLLPVTQYNKNIIDVMYKLCGNNLSNAKSLDTYSQIFNIGQKIGEASDVPKLVEQERWVELEDYCRRDAWLAKELYNKCNYYFI